MSASPVKVSAQTPMSILALGVVSPVLLVCFIIFTLFMIALGILAVLAMIVVGLVLWLIIWWTERDTRKTLKQFRKTKAKKND